MQDDDKDHDALNAPGFAASVALILALMFLVLGFALLWIGNIEGGFICLVLSVFALVSGLLRRRRGK